jgi:hypothetical protein
MDPLTDIVGYHQNLKNCISSKKNLIKQNNIYILHNMDHQDNVDNEWDLMSEWGSKTPKEEPTTSDVVVVGGRSEE